MTSRKSPPRGRSNSRRCSWLGTFCGAVRDAGSVSPSDPQDPDNQRVLDDVSRADSFYTAYQGEVLQYIPGPNARPDTSFRMGETIPLQNKYVTNVTGTTWGPSEHERFNIRIGPNYPKNGNKSASFPFLYDPIGVDVLRSDSILCNIAPNMIFPPLPDCYDSACGLPALLVINTQLPLAMPSIFASAESDPGWSVVGYYQIRPEAVAWALNRGADAPPAIAVMKRLLERGFSDRSLAFKAIGMIHDLEEQQLPMMSLLRKYNGKPVLVTASAKLNFGSVPYPYLEVDYNVRKWSLAARTTLVQLRERLASLTVHIGYLVEATEDEDLPERMIGGTTVYNLSYASARYVNFGTNELAALLPH